MEVVTNRDRFARLIHPARATWLPVIGLEIRSDTGWALDTGYRL